MAPTKRKFLTLRQRIDVIRKSESGLSARKIAEYFNVGKTQIQDILKRKKELLEDFEKNVNSDQKMKRIKTGFEEINLLTYEWLRSATSRSINVSGPMLQTQALKFANNLGKNYFKAS